MKVLIVGFGHVGRELLNIALKSTLTNACQYFVGTRSPEKHKEEFNLVYLSSMASAGNLVDVPQARLFHLNVDNLEATADELHRIKPDIIVNTASRQAWWYPNLLPAELRDRVAKNPVGPSLPNHLVPAMRLQMALAMSGLRDQTFTINASYPDVVNPVLARAGLAYDVGAGNIANPMNAIRSAAALESGLAPSKIVIRAYGHHSFSYRVTRQGDPAPVPFHVEFDAYDGRPLNLDPLKVFAHLPTTFKRTSGLPGTLMTAASIWTVLRAYVTDHGDQFYAPGPDGLEGGYTVAIRNRVVEVVPPKLVSLKDVQSINREGAVFDGIELIESDGAVVFAREPMEVIRQAFGYSRTHMRLDEAADCSDEWIGMFRRCCGEVDVAEAA